MMLSVSHLLSRGALIAITGVMAIVFSSNARSACSSEAWSSTNGSAQAIGVDTSPLGKKYEGRCGLTVDAADAPGYVSTDAPSSESVFSVRFYFFLSSFDLTSGEALIFKARDAATSQVELLLRKIDGTMHLAAKYRSGGGMVEHPETVPLTSPWHAVNMTWSTGSGTGSLSLKLDGVQQYDVEGLTNGDERVSEVDLGVINAPTATGKVVFDAFELRRTADEIALLKNEELFSISTRANVGTGDNLAIAGFIINGDTPKCVVVRGRGQSVNVGSSPRLEDPRLELKSGSTTIDSSTDWALHPSAPTLEALSLEPGDPSDAALHTCLDPGAYTVLIRGTGSSGLGIGIMEVIDADLGTPFLNSISSRMTVGPGDNLAIAGFIINGDTPKCVVVRGRGQSVNVGSSPRLEDPRLELKSGSTTIDSSTDWALHPSAPTLEALSLEPGDPSDAALYTCLDPGAYTVLIRETAGSGLGIGIVEVIDVEGGEVQPN